MHALSYVRESSPYVFRLSGVLFSFASIYLVSLTKSEEVAGEYFLFLALVTSLSVVFRFGFDDYILRNLSRDATGNVIKALTTTFCIYLFSESLGIYFGLSGGPYALVPISALFFSANYYAALIFQGKDRKLSSVFFFSMFPNLLFCVFMLLYPDTDIVNTYIFSHFSSGFIAWLFVLKLRLADCTNINSEGYTRVYTQTAKLFLILLTSQIMINAPIFGASFFYGTTYTASIGFAQKLSQLLLTALVVLNFVLAPKISRYFGNGEYEKIKSIYFSSLLFVWTVVLVSSGVLFFTFYFSDLFIVAKNYALFDYILVFVWVGYALNVSFGPIGILYTMTNNEYIASMFSGCAILLLCIAMMLAYRYNVHILGFLAFVLLIQSSTKILMLAFYYRNNWVL